MGKLKKRMTTKDKILHILKRDQNLTIKDLMEHFTISEVAVRKHLRELEKQEFIRTNVIKQDIGRPYYTYELTGRGHATFPNQYESLPLDLLRDLEDSQGTAAVKQVLARRAQREEAMFRKEIESANFDEKVESLVDLLEQRGYMFDFEKMETGDYKIINYNCPIINVANTYKQICHNERGMMGNLFPDSKVESDDCITDGDHYCKWLITRPKKEEFSL